MNSVFNKIVEIFIYSGIVQGFFFALIINRNKRWKKKSNKILALLLIILSISIAHSVFIDVNISALKIKEPFILLIGPLLFFYILEILSPRSFTWADIIHLVPFLFFVSIILPSTALDTFDNYFVVGDVDRLSLGIWIFTIIQFAFYWWKIVKRINLSQASLQMEFSNLEGKTLLWVKNFLHILGICLLVLTITIPIVLHTKNYELVDMIVCLSLVVTVFVLAYEGLFQEDIFSNRNSLESIESEQNSEKENEKSRQLNQNNSELMQKLQTFMVEKKPYLEEGLTLTGLAQQLNMTRNQLSSLINSNTGENFYSFINKYRVEEVIKIFSDPQKKNYTILAMAYEAGFPSKSSFHNIFKKITGLTPTEYLNGLK
jgi:AraC-like DNA-binding protein